MRLHTLSITAFGPFAGTVHVDVERLAEPGLFLLTGPTGAGKSSVLDAVCFALYGEVAGDRSRARRLRCDVAPEGVAPQVVLDVSIGARRFRLTRSPAWERPKKRGSGLTTQQASVLVEELVDGQLVHLTNRLDEAGQLVGDLLGMTVTQFTQVVLLPQGRFQDFLRARSEDRQQLLQRLFRTHRFEQVERWLRQHRTILRRRSEEHAASVGALVHRLEEVSARRIGTPDDDLAALAESGALVRWADDCGAFSQRAVDEALTALTAVLEADRTATGELAGARTVAELHARHAAARRTLETLTVAADEIAARRLAAREARRAQPVVLVHAQLDRASSSHTSAVAGLRRAESAAGDRLDRPHDMRTTDTTEDGHAVVAALDAAREALVEAWALQPREQELSELRVELDRAEQQVVAGHSRLATLRSTVEQAPHELTAAEAVVHRAVEAVRLLGDADSELRRLEERRDQLQRAETVNAELETARHELRAAIDHHQAQRQRWLDLQEQRLGGMAAEIATALAVGASCPVCGSCEHPHPASPSPGAPNAASEKAARRAADDADVVRQAHDDHVRQLEQRAASLSSKAGDADPGAVEEQVRDLVDRVRELSPLAEGLAAAQTRCDQARAGLASATEELAHAQAEHAALIATTSALAQRVARLTDQLTADLGSHPDVRTLVRERQETVDLLQAVIGAQQEVEAASHARELAAADLAAVLDKSGFSTATQAVAAALADRLIDEHDEAIASYERAHAAATGTLEDPHVAAVADLPVPDLPALAAAADAAADTRVLAESTHRSCRERHGRVHALRAELDAALARWAPLRREHNTAAALSALVEGKSADNSLQMRLSAYVLSWRLGQVVAAANERLVQMTDHRYTLEHTARRGAGESRGGLSLRVVDDWSGETRDPVTLSGGETFVVSLALALGLTDVVTEEAGGTHVGTLFVDEGFGSLDAETLDDVMDTLDALREGGRVVGIVSHVPELRARIPAQLRVTKSRTGSTLQMCHEMG